MATTRPIHEVICNFWGQEDVVEEIANINQEVFDECQKSMPDELAICGNDGDSTRLLCGLDPFVAGQMELWHVPGLSLAIVAGDRVLYTRGYGYRDVANLLKVSDATVFPIGSVTKSFTASAIAVLVRRGLLDWDTAVHSYLPEFQLYDRFATDRITVRDLLLHNSGLPRHDLVWYNAGLSRAELCERLRYLQPNRGFRQAFQYNNLMYAIAGHLAERVAGKRWESIVEDEILLPLQMSRTSMTFDSWRQSENHALPYECDDDDAVHQGDFRRMDTVSPAGGINSSANDMARYLLMHTNRGVYNGKSILHETDAREMQMPQTVIPEDVTHPELGHVQYGAGFYVSSYRGHKHVRHDGGLRGGFSAIISFLPDVRIGAVVLCNMSWTSIPRIVANRVLDLLLDLPPLDWSARSQQDRAARRATSPKVKPNAGVGSASLPPDHYVGKYVHPAYGSLHVSLEDEQDAAPALCVTFHGCRAPLRHLIGDIFETHVDKRNRLYNTRLNFELHWDGFITDVSVPFEPEVDDIRFRRVAEDILIKDENLMMFAGSFQIGADRYAVEVTDNRQLRFHAPDSSPSLLEPVTDRLFRQQRKSRHFIEFVFGEERHVIAMRLIRPDSDYVAVRR